MSQDRQAPRDQVEAIKKFYEDADAIYASDRRRASAIALMNIALQNPNTALGEQARQAMQIVHAGNDGLTLAKGLAKSNDSENLKAAVAWFSKSYQKAIYQSDRGTCAKGLMNIALQNPGNAVGQQALEAMQVAEAANDGLTLAHGLAESKDPDNLKAAVSWFKKSYQKCIYASDRTTSAKGLLAIALHNPTNEVGEEARQAMQVAEAANDGLTLAQGLAKSKDPDNLKAAVSWFKKSYQKCIYASDRTTSAKGLLAIALQNPTNEIGEQARQAMQVVEAANDGLRLAQGLAESKDPENLKAAVYWFKKSYQECVYASDRTTCAKGLINIALKNPNNEIGNQARQAMRIIPVTDDGLRLATGLAKSEDPENLTAAIHWFKEGYRHCIYSSERNTCLNALLTVSLNSTHPEIAKLAISTLKEEALKNNDGDLLFKIGKFYEEKSADKEALALYETSAKLGEYDSILRLANAYEKGELGLIPNPEKAANYYKQFSAMFFDLYEKTKDIKWLIHALKTEKEANQLSPKSASQIQFNIQGEKILDYITQNILQDEFKINPHLQKAIEDWCNKYGKIEDFAKLDKKTGDRIRYRIMEGEHTHNPIALFMRNKLVENWEKNANANSRELIHQFYSIEKQYGIAPKEEKVEAELEVKEKPVSLDLLQAKIQTLGKGKSSWKGKDNWIEKLKKQAEEAKDNSELIPGLQKEYQDFHLLYSVVDLVKGRIATFPKEKPDLQRIGATSQLEIYIDKYLKNNSDHSGKTQKTVTDLVSNYMALDTRAQQLLTTAVNLGRSSKESREIIKAVQKAYNDFNNKLADNDLDGAKECENDLSFAAASILEGKKQGPRFFAHSRAPSDKVEIELQKLRTSRRR